MAGRIYETTIKIAAALARNFKGETATAAAAIKQLAAESNKLGKTRAAAEALAKLQAEGKGAGVVALKLAEQLKSAGVDTANLADEQARLGRQLVATTRAMDAQKASEAARARIFGPRRSEGPLLDQVRTRPARVRDGLGALARDAAVAGGALAGAAAIPLTKFAEFEKAMGEVSTLVDTNKVSVADLALRVRALAREYGSDHATTAKALYSTISAGISDATKATEVLTIAQRLSVGGSTDVDIAITGLTSSINAYAAAGLTAQQASDAFFTAAAIGQATPEALAMSIGQLAPTAVSAGVSFDELMAAVGAVTTVIPSTEQSVSGLRGAITAILTPTGEAAKEAKRLGIQFDANALKAKGLRKFIEDLSRAEGFNAESAAKLFGRVEATNAVMVLSAGGAKTLNDAVGQMTEKAGATDKAYAKMARSLDQQAKVARAHANDIAIVIGSRLAPIAISALTRISEWLGKNQGAIETWATNAAIWIEARLIPGLQKFAREAWPVVTAVAAMVSGIAEAVGGWGNFALILAGLRIAPVAAQIAGLTRDVWRLVAALVEYAAKAIVARGATAGLAGATGGTMGTAAAGVGGALAAKLGLGVGVAALAKGGALGLAKLGGAVTLAAAAGYGVGTLLDRTFGISDKIGGLAGERAGGTIEDLRRETTARLALQGTSDSLTVTVKVDAQGADAPGTAAAIAAATPALEEKVRETVRRDDRQRRRLAYQ